MRRLPFLAAVAVLAALTAGCSSGKGGSKLVCPGSVVAPNLDTLAEMPPGGSDKREDALFGARIAAINSTCDREDGGMVITSRILFDVARGDKNVHKRDVVYFVAIADTQQHILAKQTFTFTVEFAPRQNDIRLADEITEHLPLKDVSAGGNYGIIIGFQLTPDQLEFNRKHATSE